MGCPSEVFIGENFTFSVATHDPDTGVVTDVDAATPPSYRIYEDSNETAILTGNMDDGSGANASEFDDANTTGLYVKTLACTIANGFEHGKTYTIYITATVDSDPGAVTYAFKTRRSRRQEVEHLAGVRTWPIYGDDKLFDHEANDNGFASFSGSTVWDGTSLWRHYYTSKDASSRYQIRYRTSADGKGTWSAGTTVLTQGQGSHDAQGVLLPIVWREGASDWRMIYTATTVGNVFSICYATSTDGITWTKEATNPVMEGNAGDWERGAIEAVGIIKVSSTYYLQYSSQGFRSGRDATSRQSSYATSTDLVNWTKSPTCVWGHDDDEALNGPFYGTLGGPVIYVSNHYFQFIVRYGPNSDYEFVELWECHLPTFDRRYRRRVGIVLVVNDTAFPDSEIDVLAVATDDVNRNSFTVGGLGGEIRLYFGAKHSGSWYSGLATAASTLEALRPGRSIADQITSYLWPVYASADSIAMYSAVAGTLSTTQMSTDLPAGLSDNHFRDRAIIWTTGNLRKQAKRITAYDGADKIITFDEVTEAPAAGDRFIIV